MCHRRALVKLQLNLPGALEISLLPSCSLMEPRLAAAGCFCRAPHAAFSPRVVICWAPRDELELGRRTLLPLCSLAASCSLFSERWADIASSWHPVGRERTQRTP